MVIPQNPPSFYLLNAALTRSNNQFSIEGSGRRGVPVGSGFSPILIQDVGGSSVGPGWGGEQELLGAAPISIGFINEFISESLPLQWDTWLAGRSWQT